MEINYISVNDLFWVQNKEHLTSFGFKGLPEDLHFTLSYNANLSDVNLHVTKNMNDERFKPRVTIACMSKTEINAIDDSLAIALLRKLLKPIEIKEVQRKFKNIGFISFHKLESPPFKEWTEQEILNKFKTISAIKKKNRLKIKGEIEPVFESIVLNKKFQKFAQNVIEKIPEKFHKEVEGGMIITESEVFSVIIAHGRWYKISTSTTPMDFLNVLFPPELILKLIWSIKRAIVLVKNSKSHSDLLNTRETIRFVKSKK